jgi:hypothetical protein
MNANKTRILMLGFLCLALLFTMMPDAALSRERRAAMEWDEAEIRALLFEGIRRSNQNWEAMSRHYADYSFKWRRALREKDGKGKFKEESELYEVYATSAKCWTKKCRRALVLLEENGKPVAPERLEKERLKVGAQMEKDERGLKESTARSSVNESIGLNWMRFFVSFNHFARKSYRVLLDGQEILEKCEFTSPHREVVAGREMIALEFRPRASSTFRKESDYMAAVEGKIWIDAADKVFVRLAAWPKGTKFDRPESDYLLEHAALAYDLVRTKEGIWFFKLGRISGAQYSDLFPKLKKDFSIEQFDYTYFKVEVEQSQIEEP